MAHGIGDQVIGAHVIGAQVMGDQVMGEAQLFGTPVLWVKGKVL